MTYNVDVKFTSGLKKLAAVLVGATFIGSSAYNYVELGMPTKPAEVLRVAAVSTVDTLAASGGFVAGGAIGLLGGPLAFVTAPVGAIMCWSEVQDNMENAIKASQLPTVPVEKAQP